MAFYFTCPYCYKKTLIDDSYAGQQGPCATCGKLITIPGEPPEKPETAQPIDGSYVAVEANRPEMRFVAYILMGLGVVAGIAIVTAVGAYLLWPTLIGLKERRDKVACMNNLQRIADALNNYAAEHGSYPPPVVYDDKGRPMHSWRVLILNELGYSNLYALYDFTKPWDSTENSTLMARCPEVFISPAANTRSGSENNYALVTGKGTLFPSSGPLGPKDVVDGTANTLLVVESQNNLNVWTEPVDVDFAKMSRRIGTGNPGSIGGNHQGGATAVFADGSPAWLADDLDPILLDSIITPRGGEPVDADDYQLK